MALHWLCACAKIGLGMFCFFFLITHSFHEKLPLKCRFVNGNALLLNKWLVGLQIVQCVVASHIFFIYLCNPKSVAMRLAGKMVS